MLVSCVSKGVTSCLFVCVVWSVCTIWWTTLLCQAMRRHFMFGCMQVDSRYGHVSMTWFGHNVQFQFGCDWSWYVFLWFPIYCAHWDFNVCVICGFDMLGAF